MPSRRLIPDVRRSEAISDGKVLHAPGGWRDIRPTYAEIDLEALCANASWLKRRIGAAGLLGVVKADGYGHGAIVVARALTEHTPVAGLCVSLAEEGIELRDAGIGGFILVMGGCYGQAHRDVAALGLTPVVFDLRDVEAFARSGQPVGIHVKVDTGMSRLGVRPEDLDAFLEGCSRFPAVRIEGLMTHLACADSDPEMTRAQLDRLAAVEPRVRAAARGGRLVVHTANTAGTLAFADAHRDAVRPGLALYGGGDPALKPVLRLVTQIVSLRDLAPGDTVSYGAHFTAAQPTRIATLPVGYADGYPRRLSAHVAGRPTSVLVRGRRCPVVGAVCMDMLMLDVTALGELVSVGDEVVLLGRQGDEVIRAAELAEHAGLIEYEITCGISKRVPRRVRSTGA
jgi:alanine racemase